MNYLFKNSLKYCFIFMLVLLSGSAFADDPDCDELFTLDPAAFADLCTDDESGPLDSGVLILIAVGGAFAIKNIRKSALNSKTL